MKPNLTPVMRARVPQDLRDAALAGYRRRHGLPDELYVSDTTLIRAALAFLAELPSDAIWEAAAPLPRPRHAA